MSKTVRSSAANLPVFRNVSRDTKWVSLEGEDVTIWFDREAGTAKWVFSDPDDVRAKEYAALHGGRYVPEASKDYHDAVVPCSFRKRGGRRR